MENLPGRSTEYQKQKRRNNSDDLREKKTTCTLYQFDGTFRIEILFKTVLLES